MRRAVVLLVLLAGCSGLFAPQEPESVDFTPPASYARLWSQIDSCSGLSARRPLSAVRFAVAIAASPDSFFSESHGWSAGHYDAHHNRIVLSPTVVGDSNRHVYDSYVRHEMLHAHLPISGHPQEYFGSPPNWIGGKCGSLVSR